MADVSIVPQSRQERQRASGKSFFKGLIQEAIDQSFRPLNSQLGGFVSEFYEAGA